MFRKIAAGLKHSLAFLNRYRGEILYYATVLLVLSAIAWGAEQYRIRRDAEPVTPPVAAAAEILQPETAETQFELPEGMRLVQDFSSAPLWNEQDQCWQAHPAVDFACGDGLVRALGDGSVQAVGESGVRGGFIEVVSGEVVLKYCCLKPEEALEPGKDIRKGDLIGTAENAMPGEKQLGAHLHLEAYQNGEIINLRDLLAGKD